MDRVLTALAALEKTVGYDELDDTKRKAIGETLSSHVSRVLTSIQHGKRGKVSNFQF